MQENITTKLDSFNFKPITQSESEVLDFINNIKNKDHAILLFQNEHVRDKLVKDFLDKSKNQIFTACFAHDLSKYECDKAITYNELIDNKKLNTVQVSEFLIRVLDEAYPNDFPRVACEDTLWFSEVGFFEEHQKIGNHIDKKIFDESAILCCYDMSKLDDDKMDTVLQSRNYVILEEPLAVYQRNQ